MNKLTHFDEKGLPKMVDVSDKATTQRKAIAKSTIIMKKETIQMIKNKELSKGDVISVATVGGIMGVKMTSQLIPMCHNIFISGSNIEFDIKDDCIHIFVTAKTSGQTGIEMEALMGATMAALTIYDMCKAVDKTMVITDTVLLEKTGGKSGDYKNEKYINKQ